MKRLLLSLASMLFIISISGQTTFEKTYDIYNSAFSDLVFSQNDGYLMAMLSEQENYSYFLSLVKTDLNGDTLWTKNYETGLTGLTDLCGTDDEQGNIYISYNDQGIGNHDLLKLDSNGNIIWSKNYQTLKREMIVKDNVLWICGNTQAGNYLYKIDAMSGDSLWRSDLFNIDTTGWISSHSTSIAITENNEVVVTVSFDDFYEPFLLESKFYKLLPNTTELVQFTLNITDPIVVIDTKNIGNELISVANHVGFSSDNSCYFIRYTSDGTILAFTEEVFGYNSAILYKCVITDDNKVVAMGGAVTGPQSGYVMLHAFTMNGDSLWTELHGNIFQTGWDLKITADNGFIVTGGEEVITSSNYKPILLKTNSLGVLTSITEKVNDFQANVYPNPATENVIFETPGIKTGYITILNSVGKIQTEVKITNEKTYWNCGNINSGLYIYKITSDKGFSSGKIVIN